MKIEIKRIGNSDGLILPRELMQRLDVVKHLRGASKLSLAAFFGGNLDHQFLTLWQEFVQGRVESSDRDGIALHLAEKTGEVTPLHRQKLVECAAVLRDRGSVGLLRGRKLCLDGLSLR